MIKLIQQILHQAPDPEKHAPLIKEFGVRELFDYLSYSDLNKQIYPEDMVRLLSVIHVLLREEHVRDLFQIYNIHWVTDLNVSYGNERLNTEVSASSTFNKSINVEITPPTTQPMSRAEKISVKRKECMQSFSEKVDTTTLQNDPLPYYQICSTYYQYLKKWAHLIETQNMILNCYLIQNLQSIGLRIIEGQRNNQLMFCFKLILKDFDALEQLLVEYVMKLLKSDCDKVELFNIYQQMLINRKHVKWFQIQNKLTINKPLHFFKQNCHEFVKQTKQQLRKIKIINNSERITAKELKGDQFYAFERKKLYDQY